MLLANYAQIARRSALTAAVAGVVMAVVSVLAGGGKGLLGSVLGIALVAAFFAISVLVVGRAARVSPQAMQAAAMATFVVKIVALLFFVVAFSHTSVFNTRLFGLTALACILVWSGSQAAFALRQKVPYVEPSAEQLSAAHVKPDGER